MAIGQTYYFNTRNSNNKYGQASAEVHYTLIQSKENLQLVPITASPTHLSQHYPPTVLYVEIYVLWFLSS